MSETPPPPPPYGQDPNQPQQPQPPYGQPPQPPPYGQQQYGQPYAQQPPGQPPPTGPYGQPQMYAPILPDHPQATTVLILGIVGIVACGLAAPFAWVMGNRVVAEIDASGGQLGGRSSANAGRICGIVGTIILGLGLLVVIGSFIFIIAVGASSTA